MNAAKQGRYLRFHLGKLRKYVSLHDLLRGHGPTKHCLNVLEVLVADNGERATTFELRSKDETRPEE